MGFQHFPNNSENEPNVPFFTAGVSTIINTIGLAIDFFPFLIVKEGKTLKKRTSKYGHSFGEKERTDDSRRAYLIMPHRYSSPDVLRPRVCVVKTKRRVHSRRLTIRPLLQNERVCTPNYVIRSQANSVSDFAKKNQIQ